MRLADWREGWVTDAIVHRFEGEIVERDDCLVVRTPSNPTFYWGNCLVVQQPPADADLAHWLARFDEEIGRRHPGSRHVAIGIDAEWQGEQWPAWQAAGFEVIVSRMLRLRPGGLVPPPRAPRGAVELREIDLARDTEAVLEVELTDIDGFEPAGYRVYRERKHRAHAAMQAAGVLTWFGLWCDGRLAATCGLMREGAQGRFQHVVTHAGYRRRGLCSALIHGVARHALERWGCQGVYMAADPDDVAIGIYRSVGFADLSTASGLQRRPPHDRR